MEQKKYPSTGVSSKERPLIKEFLPVRTSRFQTDGITGKLADGIEKNWLLGLRETNPAILDMFFERDRQPYLDLLPWSGEFAGKYLTGAYYIYRLTGSECLLHYITGFIDELLTCQDTDGYLGCYSSQCHLTGAFSSNPENSGGTWDAWSHYHLMYGLLLWHSVTGQKAYFQCVERMADLFMKTFYTDDANSRRLVDIGSSEMNLAPYHVFGILYNKTGREEYLAFAKEIEEDISDARAGDYINSSLRGLEYYQCAKPRWESMHIIMGIDEMYRAAGDDTYLKVARQIFDSILKTDVHNTGAFSTNEQACGSPFMDGPIETCCVVAYNALGVELYKLTGDSRIVDFLELSHYNAVMGSFNPTGRWSTYNTPMEGNKCANFHSIGFQCRPGSPELNCCSVNAPRGVGMFADWMIAERDNILYINAYEPLTAVTADGDTIEICSSYPLNGDIHIHLSLHEKRKAALRIPAWSLHTVLTVNGQPIHAAPGGYVLLEQVSGKIEIELCLDFHVRFLNGEGQYEGRSSIYYGPLLYGCDTSLAGRHNVTELPSLSHAELSAARPEPGRQGRFLVKLSDGITLCDFRMLGYSGAQYVTFFKVV